MIRVTLKCIIFQVNKLFLEIIILQNENEIIVTSCNCYFSLTDVRNGRKLWKTHEKLGE